MMCVVFIEEIHQNTKSLAPLILFVAKQVIENCVALEVYIGSLAEDNLP